MRISDWSSDVCSSDLLHKRGAWFWDALDEQWVKLDRAPRPGMTLLQRAAAGGYDPTIGFDANVKTPPVSIVPPTASAPEQAYSEDWRSRQNKPVPFAEPLGQWPRDRTSTRLNSSPSCALRM